MRIIFFIFEHRRAQIVGTLAICMLTLLTVTLRLLALNNNFVLKSKIVYINLILNDVYLFLILTFSIEIHLSNHCSLCFKLLK